MSNERTSKRVASKAATLQRRIKKILTDLEKLSRDIASVAGSALTQAPDKTVHPWARPYRRRRKE